MKQHRRTFVKRAGQGLLTLGWAPLILKRRHGTIGANDQVNLALMGCNNRGFHVLLAHLKVPGVNCVALCDIDRTVLEKRRQELLTTHGQGPIKTYEDYREMLEQRDIDALIIGTPDHWHCLPLVHACEMGLDVYVEKPLANSIAECDVMVEAVRKYNRVVQVGQQQRSSKVWNQVMEYLKGGALGPVQRVDIWANFNYGLGPMRINDAAPPDGVNWDMFLGPAPSRPFNKARYHGSWRFFWDYGGGLMTDWGVHLLDMALWARDLSRPPDRVMAYGAQMDQPDRARETHDTMTAIFPYDDYIIQWEHNAGKQVGPYDRLYGAAFVGSNGTLVADRSKWEVYPEWDGQTNTPKTERIEPTVGTHGHEQHPANFIDCLKTREEPACPIEIGRAVAVMAHMANIAARTGQYHLEWDETKRRFNKGGQANALLEPAYRKSWKFPRL